MFALRSFDCMQNDALERMQLFLMSANEVNNQFKGYKGATQLWKAAELGCHLAVKELLQHPNIEPNTTHKRTGTTPLYIAAYFGHERVVKALLSHPSIQVNQGKGQTTPLFIAAQEGREGVVKMLLGCKDVNIDKASTEGITPARVAFEFGHEYIYSLLSLQKGGHLYSAETREKFPGSSGSLPRLRWRRERKSLLSTREFDSEVAREGHLHGNGDSGGKNRHGTGRMDELMDDWVQIN
jgi:hypothetical protein